MSNACTCKCCAQRMCCVYVVRAVPRMQGYGGGGAGGYISASTTFLYSSVQGRGHVCYEVLNDRLLLLPEHARMHTKEHAHTHTHMRAHTYKHEYTLTEDPSGLMHRKQPSV